MGGQEPLSVNVNQPFVGFNVPIAVRDPGADVSWERPKMVARLTRTVSRRCMMPDPSRTSLKRPATRRATRTYGKSSRQSARRVEKGIPLARRRIALFVDVYNILNTNAEQQFVTASGSAWLLRPILIIGPRNARIGAKFEW